MTNCGDDRQPTLVAVPKSGLWDADQVAQLLGLTKGWVYAQVRERTGLPFIRFGKRTVRFDPDAVRAWLKAQSSQEQAG